MSLPPLYDVAILGSGIGGSMLACFLARAGARVLLLEESSHPRFAIGESLIPETGVRLRILAEKYGVPEVGWLGNFHSLRDNVSSNCGVKRSFAFMYHRPGEEARAEELSQLPTLTPPFGPDSHLFRQDTDAWLAALALRHGADLRQQTRVEHLRFEADGVRLEARGEAWRARFLVDAGGMRSLPASLLGLRDAQPRFRTNTRALYNHFIGLRPADLLFPGGHGLPSPLGQATMHHVFDGAWMWIIPFQNHRDATNPLTSVGLMLDRRQHPEATAPPEAEFRRIISRYPSVARHFAGARALRPWTATGRLQYSSPHILAPRLFQLPHAASFVDPLYSSGMSVLTVSLDMLTEQLLSALAEDRFELDRFRPIEQVVNEGFDHYDLIVSRSFDSFAHGGLWRAWNRNWALGNFLGTFGALSLLMRYLCSGDRQVLAQSTARHRIGVLSSQLPEVREVMLASAEDVAAATGQDSSPEAAAERIYARLGALDFVPPYMGFGRPDQRAPAAFTLQEGARHVLWYRGAPPRWRELAEFPLLPYARMALGFSLGSLGDGLRRGAATLRDVFFPGNGEWREPPLALTGDTQPWAALEEPKAEPLPAAAR